MGLPIFLTFIQTSVLRGGWTAGRKASWVLGPNSARGFIDLLTVEHLSD